MLVLIFCNDPVLVKIVLHLQLLSIKFNLSLIFFLLQSNVGWIVVEIEFLRFPRLARVNKFLKR
jgi:hypothetical protein